MIIRLVFVEEFQSTAMSSGDSGSSVAARVNTADADDTPNLFTAK
jgi:hypothetical protein